MRVFIIAMFALFFESCSLLVDGYESKVHVDVWVYSNYETTSLLDSSGHAVASWKGTEAGDEQYNVFRTRVNRGDEYRLKQDDHYGSYIEAHVGTNYK